MKGGENEREQERVGPPHLSNSAHKVLETVRETPVMAAVI